MAKLMSIMLRRELHEWGSHERRKVTAPVMLNVPMALLEPHEAQASTNHGQTLARLAERGGLSPCEAVAILEDRRWHLMSDDDAYRRLFQHYTQFQQRQNASP